MRGCSGERAHALSGFADLSEEEQIAWAEKAAENLRARVLESEKREINWSEEAGS